jgi:hypothetical protein
MSRKKCVDSDPALAFQVLCLAALCKGADQVQLLGTELYHTASRLLKYDGLADFHPRFELGMDAATVAQRQLEARDVLRIFGHEGGDMTERCVEVVIKLLWAGGTPSKFSSTLGELYALRQIRRDDMVSAAAAAMGIDVSDGVLILSQVPHVSGIDRVYDWVIVRRPSGATRASYKSVVDADVIMRVDAKWYLAVTSTVDTTAVRQQFFLDMVQSELRSLKFRDLYYGMPADAPHQLGDATAVIVDVFEHEVRELLSASGYSTKKIDTRRKYLDEHIADGKMVFLTEASSD